MVVQFITPAFLKSSFCMLELGAACAQQKAFPLLLPPLTASDLAGGPLSGLQGAALASGDGLDELRDRVSDLAGVHVRTAGWAPRRERALRDITSALDHAPSGHARLAAVGVRDHHIEIWALGDATMTHSWWRNDGGEDKWNEPRNFPAPRGITDMAVASAGPSHAEVFTLDNGGTLWRRSWTKTSDGQRTGRNSISALAARSRPAAGKTGTSKYSLTTSGPEK